MDAAIQWPLVVARLVALLPTLAGWSGVLVLDGPVVTDDIPDKYCTVAHVDTDGSGDDLNAGDVDLQPSGDGFFHDETGTVRCLLVCETGDGDAVANRTAAFALFRSLAAYIGRQRRLELFDNGTSQVQAEVLSLQNQAGAACCLLLTVTYQVQTAIDAP